MLRSGPFIVAHLKNGVHEGGKETEKGERENRINDGVFKVNEGTEPKSW